MELWELSSDFKRIDVDRDTMAICNPQVREAALIYNGAIDKIHFGRTAEARSDLRRATQLYPGFDDAYILLGLCIFASGNRIDAMRTFNQISDPEKHALAMRYFDMLSFSAKDMVTDYKKKQLFREPVRTQTGKPPVRRSEAQESGRTQTERKTPAKNESVPPQRPKQTAPKVISETPKKTAHREQPVHEEAFYDFGESQEIVDPFIRSLRKDASAEDAEGKSAPVKRDPGKENGSVFFDTETEPAYGTAATVRKDPVKSEVPPRQRKAAQPAEPKVQAPRSMPVQNERTASGTGAGESRQAALRKAAGNSARRNRTMAFIIVSCFVILAATAVIVAASNRESLFGKGSFVRGPGAATEVPVGSTETPGPSDETGQGTPPVSETPPATATPEPATPDPEKLKQEAIDRLAEAERLLTARAYHECYVLVVESDWAYLPQEQHARLEQVKSSSFAPFCNEYYNLMYSNVAPENWDEVLKYGLELLKYCPDYERGAPVYFNVGKAYEETGDKANAEKYYKLTIEKYPQSNDASYAQYKLSRLYS